MEGRMERNQFLGDFINQIKPYLKPPPATEFFFFFEPTDFLYCLCQFNLGFL